MTGPAHTLTLDTAAATAIQRLTADQREALARDLRRALTADLGFDLRAEPPRLERAEGGVCDGTSYLADRVIFYRATGNRRENFTLCHELGHALVEQSDELMDWLFQQADPGKMLETLCDRIAQALLLPDHVVDQILGGQPVTAQDLNDLFEQTQASAPACAIALARRIRGLGAVVITDPEHEHVQYASVTPDPEQGWPTVFPWPRQPIPDAHPLRLDLTGRTLRRRSFWQMPWGTSNVFYLNATSHRGRGIAVLAAHDLWGAERLHLDTPRDFDQRPTQIIRCCGTDQALRGWPCPTCRQIACPTCDQCRCDRQAAMEVRCAGSCGMRYLPHLLTNGLCEDCA